MKDNAPKAIFIFLVVMWIVANLGCSPTQEVSPLTDKLFLQYKYSISSPLGQKDFFVRFSFSEVAKDYYQIDILSQDEQNQPVKMHFDEGTKLLVDKLFKTTEGEYFNLDIFGYLWIPRSQRKEGVTFGEYTVGGRRQWNKWKVFVLQKEMGPEQSINFYYHTQTGFLVGSEASSGSTRMNAVLLETNAQGLTE
jgi:hypothetical protein